MMLDVRPTATDNQTSISINYLRYDIPYQWHRLDTETSALSTNTNLASGFLKGVL